MTKYVWPADLVANRCEFYLQPNTTQFRSPITRTRQVLKRQGKRWVGTFHFTVGRKKAQRIDALLDKLEGPYNTVTIWDMAHCGPLGANRGASGLPITYFITYGSPDVITGFTSGAPAVITGFYGGAGGAGGAGEIVARNAHAIGERYLRTRGWYPNATALMAGDYVEVGGHLYRALDDVEANGYGYATVALNRPLRTAVGNGEEVVRTHAREEMQLIDDDQANRGAGVDGIYEYSLSFVEAL